MFSRNEAVKSKEIVKGVGLKALSWGKRMMLTQFTIQKNSAVPMHSHPHEQIGYLASGRLELTVEKKAFIANAGDSWCIPADAEHSAIGIETCVVIEVFSPVRKEYLPENK